MTMYKRMGDSVRGRLYRNSPPKENKGHPHTTARRENDVDQCWRSRKQDSQSSVSIHATGH